MTPPLMHLKKTIIRKNSTYLFSGEDTQFTQLPHQVGLCRSPHVTGFVSPMMKQIQKKVLSLHGDYHWPLQHCPPGNIQFRTE